MKKLLLAASIFILGIIVTGCSLNKNAGDEAGKENCTYESITAEQAKDIMDKDSNFIILDVRTQSEYDEGHVPGAILIPDDEINEKAPDILKDKSQTILVYCRSGRRSKNASKALADMGYSNVKDFGGITSWPYEIEK